MDVAILSKLYYETLQTHKELTEAEIRKGIPILIQKYGDDLLPIIHLNIDTYIGKLSPQFNQKVDNFLKSGQLDSTLELGKLWELDKLTESEKTELLALEELYLIALINTINYLKSVNYQYPYLRLFGNILQDLAIEHNIQLDKYSPLVKYQFQDEVGCMLNICHIRYIDLADLTSVKLNPELQKKYQKELKILS